MIHPITRKIKLIDFGSAMRIQDLPVTTFYGTQKFACPESIRDGAYRLEDQETWALGTLLYVMLFKMDPFANDYEVLKVDIGDRISRVRKGTGVGDGIPITDMAYELLVSMMHKVANRRPRISEILKFAWLK